MPDPFPFPFNKQIPVTEPLTPEQAGITTLKFYSPGATDGTTMLTIQPDGTMFNKDGVLLADLSRDELLDVIVDLCLIFGRKVPRGG